MALYEGFVLRTVVQRLGRNFFLQRQCRCRCGGRRFWLLGLRRRAPARAHVRDHDPAIDGTAATLTLPRRLGMFRIVDIRIDILLFVVVVVDPSERCRCRRVDGSGSLATAAAALALS